MKYISNQKLELVRKVAFAWVLKHKYAVVIGTLLLYILLWPKGVPVQRGEEAAPETTTEVHEAPAATRPTSSTTRPAAQQYAGSIPLYPADLEGGDPRWGLPAELSGAALHDLATQVDTLCRDIPATIQLQSQFEQGVTQLMDDHISNLFWSRLMGKGFRDKNLPLDWYQVVKDRNSTMGEAAAMIDAMANAALQNLIGMRLQSVRIRVIGGNVLIGDTLFVKAVQAYVHQRKPYYEKLLPLMQRVVDRTRAEFSAELAPPSR